MKKKLIAAGLVLSLTLSVSAVAFATSTPAPETSQAGIDFVEYEFENEGVYDPDPGPGPGPNPDLPGDPSVWAGIRSMELYFGEHYVSFDEEIYCSYDDGDSMAGMAVVSNTPWTVAVSISDFYVDGDVAPGNETMVGFELQLIPNGDVASFRGNESLLNLHTVTIDTTAGADIADGVRGAYAENFVGKLTVPGDSTVVGEHQAELTWTFIRN
jgi:hypothetical protein